MPKFVPPAIHMYMYCIWLLLHFDFLLFTPYLSPLLSSSPPPPPPFSLSLSLLSLFLSLSLSSGDNNITVEQLDKALLALRGTSLKAKQRSLFSVLDEDHDGNIKLDEIAEVSTAAAGSNNDNKKFLWVWIKSITRIVWSFALFY